MSVVRTKRGAVRGVRGLVAVGESMIRDDLRVAEAVAAGVAHGGGVYWPELGPLNTAERALARRVTAECITYDCSRPEVLIRCSR